VANKKHIIILYNRNTVRYLRQSFCVHNLILWCNTTMFVFHITRNAPMTPTRTRMSPLIYMPDSFGVWTSKSALVWYTFYMSRAPSCSKTCRVLLCASNACRVPIRYWYSSMYVASCSLRFCFADLLCVPFCHYALKLVLSAFLFEFFINIIYIIYLWYLLYMPAFDLFIILGTHSSVFSYIQLLR